MRRGVLLLLALAALAGCGGGGQTASAPDPFDEPNDAPAHPPPGWRTVANVPAGFSVAAPRTWRARERAGATVLRSEDHLVVVDIAADRTATGRDDPAARYAVATLRGLPGFRGRISSRTTPVRGSPYESAIATARGRIRSSRTPQLITAAAFRRPERVSYAAIVFRNARLASAVDAAAVRGILRSFRARPPYVTTD